MKTKKVMKTMKKNILSLAALLIASATFVACSNDENIIEEQPVNPAQQVYTMTIQASKLSGDDATTRGLYWNNPSTYDEIKVYWHEGEKVRVVQNNVVVGTLTAAASETSETTLSGTLTGVTQNADLKFFLHADENCKMDYTGQKGGVVKQYDNDGNIEYNYDFAEATLTMAQFRLNSETGTITNMDNSVVSFTSQQAIVRFELCNGDGSSNVYAKKLIISDANTGKIVQSIDGLTGEKTYGPLTHTPTSQSCFFTVALNVASDARIVLDAVGSDGTVYSYNKPSVTFTPGKYYKVKVKMTERTLKFVNEVSPSDTYLQGWYVTQYGTVVKTYDESSCYAVVGYVGKVDHYFDNFVAIALTDSKADGTSGSEEIEWSNAQTAAYKFESNHHVYEITSTQSTTQYDAVHDDITTSSATATGAVQKGWRLPSVTDWRYIIEGLAGTSATDPVGVKTVLYAQDVYGDTDLQTKLNDYNLNLGDYRYWTNSEAVESNTLDAWFFVPKNYQISGTIFTEYQGFHAYVTAQNEGQAFRFRLRPVFAY